MAHVAAEALLDLLLSVPQDRRRDFLHVLACPRCRRAFDVPAAPAAEGEGGPPGLERAWRRAPTLDARAEAVLRQDESEVQAMLDELLPKAGKERMLAVMDQPRFHSPGLARRLLREAAAARAGDAGHARSLALLALAAAVWADKERFPRAVLDGLRIQAACLVAEASGLQGRVRDAELWLATSMAYLEDYPCDALERAFLCRILGLQRSREGRRDEALALLGRAVEIFADHGEGREVAETQVEEAWIYYDGGDPSRALLLFQQALELLPARQRPEARLRCLGGLVLALEELGRAEEADAALEEGMALARRVPLVPDGQRFETVRARSAELRGRAGETVAVLEALFRRLLEEACPFEAAVVGLDLARIHAMEGRAPELRAVLADMAPLPKEARQAVRVVLELLARADQETEKVLRWVQEDLGCARHDPGHRFGVPFRSVPPLARIELIPPKPGRGPWIKLSGEELVSDRRPGDPSSPTSRTRHAAPDPEARVYILKASPVRELG
jgi:tetratricopeptide (TPR) repeat protein